MYRIRFLIFALLLLLGYSPLFSGVEIGKSLQVKLEQSTAEEVLPVWIFFTDKGANWQQQLTEVEQHLLPAARKRRLRNRPADRLTDFYDIPVKAAYLREVVQTGAKIRHKSRWLNAVSVNATPAQIEQIRSFPFVKKINLIKRFKGPEIPEEQPVPANINLPTEQTHLLNYGPSLTQNQQIHTPELHDLGYNGSGVIIAMLDAGFNNLQHQALSSIHILKTWDFVNGDSIVWDEPGQMGSGNHGTYTLGTIAGYYPGQLIGPAYGASFLLAKTENTDWERHIEEDHWVAGAEWADSLGADIISSSLGYRDFDPPEPSYTWQDMDGNTAIVTIGADIAASRGILVVNSAGNEGSATPSNPNTLVAPSDGDSVLAAGAVNASGQRTYFSSVGPTADGRIKPDVMAMGSGVVAPSVSSPNGYASVDGTSFSCPLTAGAAALILQASPSLSNMQIINALRATASNASNPNNEYGWGIVNAFLAAFYYTPHISHAPLGDKEDLTGPYKVIAYIKSQFPLNSDSLRVYYRYGQGNFQFVPLQLIGAHTYQAYIPGPGTEADVFYYIRAVSDSGVVATHPANAPNDLHQFHVGPDLIPPEIMHLPIQNAPYLNWPVTVRAVITDNMGVDDNQVYVEWKKNGVVQNNFILSRLPDSVYAAPFNLDTSSVQIGDVIEYRIHASDSASSPNVSYDPGQGYHQFTVLETRGVVLVIDDESGSRGMVESRGQTVNYQPESGQSSTSLITHYLQQLSFLVTTEPVATTNPANWNQYQLIISASGENPSPVSSSAYRQALIQHIQNGGKVLVEGGEVGYDALAGNNYPNFAAQVIHSTDWNGDDEGPLQLLSSQSQHPMVTTPNPLPSSIVLDYNSWYGWYDQDATSPDGASYIVYQPQSKPGDAGILIYDDNANPLSAQIVYWAFDFSSITDTVTAKQLLENTVVYLLTDENPSGISDPNANLPDRVELFANYPNPFNPETVIRFRIPAAGKVNVSVYNTLGQRVSVLMDGRKKAGEYEITWNAREFASGIYYIILKAQGKQRVRKAILLK